MKRPTPKVFGLSGEHAPETPAGAYSHGLDPQQPLTDQELDESLQALIVREALRRRQELYELALENYDYLNSSR